MDHLYDVVIIGAGVAGCAIARELSRYRLHMAVLEKESDAGMGISGRNSGVVHAGFNCTPGTLKAGMCVEGCRRFEAWCRELGVPYRKTGKLVVALGNEDLAPLQALMDAGVRNGVQDLRIIGPEEMREMEPHIGGIAAMTSPWTGVTSPYELTIGLAENAHANGVEFYFSHPVTRIRREGNTYRIQAGEQMFRSRAVVNAAGLFSDRVAAMIGDDTYTLHPCRGEYYILDKRISALLHRPVYPVPRPGEGGLGVHLTTTVDGNVLIGPSAEYIEEREDHGTTREVMEQLYQEARQLLPEMERKDIIRDYAGIRPKLVGKKVGGFGDFIIRESDKNPGFVNLIGIESPGLTSAPLIGEYVADILGQRLPLAVRPDFQPVRRPPVRFREASDEEKARLIASDPAYGVIVCRCEEITLREVLDAMNNPLGVRTLTGIKYRTRAMMGRCQGGYCLPRMVELLQETMGLAPEEVTLKGPGSELFSGRVKTGTCTCSTCST
ncbi:MAG TPA: FAD/NAD(P)-binding oxidoreductase [Clostridiales bacterium]|nr:FAD/NAD(P)-binding oxidoreductase [Clostridiales bacterium]